MNQPTGPSDRDLLFAGMQQLQDVVAKMAKGSDRDDSNSPTSPETVKPGELKSDGGSLLYQDWLVVIGGLIGDVSDSAGVCYGSWISSSPIDRLRVEPVVPSELLQGRWTRVNLRVCRMLMAGMTESIRSDVVARKCNQSAPALLFRLHTTYQPGGGSEKALILKSLQQPEVAKDPASAVKSLRDWIRWYNRCVDCNMSPPDTTVLSQSLTTITSQVLAHNEEAKFRTFMLRAMLKMDAQPTSTAVLEYHKHLLAECEALAVSKPAEATKPGVRAMGPNSPPGGKAGGQAGKPLCKFFLGASGCKRGGNTHMSTTCQDSPVRSAARSAWHAGPRLIGKRIAPQLELEVRKDRPQVGRVVQHPPISRAAGHRPRPCRRVAYSLHADGVCGVQCFCILLQPCAAHCFAFVPTSSVELPTSGFGG